jgi:hypothetical protein
MSAFFGTHADLLEVWRWLFETPSMKVFEAYSRPDQPNRQFGNWRDLHDALGEGDISLAAWPEHAGAPPTIEQIVFEPNTVRKLGARGRTVLRSPAFITVAKNNDQMGCLASGSTSCWSEAGARQRSIYPQDVLDQVNWTELSRSFRRLEKQIRAASSHKLRSCPIMPDAFRRLESGQLRLWAWGEPCGYPSPLIEPTG